MYAWVNIAYTKLTFSPWATADDVGGSNQLASIAAHDAMQSLYMLHYRW